MGSPRLAMLFPSREVGGAERYAQTVARAARARGWSVAAGFPGTAPMAAFRQELLADGIPSPVVAYGEVEPVGTRAALASMARELLISWRAMARQRASVLLLNLPHPDQSPGLVLAAALYPARTAVVVHLVPGDLEITRLRRLVYRLGRATGQVWISVSQDNGERLAAALGWPRSAVRTVYNGVAVTEHDPGERADVRRRVRAELGVSGEAQFILSVARLSHQKAHDVLLDAIPAVAAAHPDALWVWAGDGENREALAAQARELGVADRVLMLGLRSDVPDLLIAADLFVMPSRSEGMPFALLEAMAAGVPVVASALPMIGELIADGVEGDLVPVEDAAALSAALDRALSDPERRIRLADAGLRRVRERHSAEQMIEGVLGVF